MRVCTWDEFTRDVLTLYASPMRRPATCRKMRQVLAEFGSLCRSPAELTPATIAGWIAAHPGRRPETVAALLRAMSAACTFAARWGYMAANPFEFRSPTAWVDWDAPELDPPVHSAEAIARVLTLADREAREGPWAAARLRALVYAYAFTGARKREILGLAIADVDLAAGTLAIRTNRRRGLKTRGSSACLPVPAPLAEILAGWMPRAGCEWLFPGARMAGPWLEGPQGGKAIDQVEALGRRAGVAGLTIASFRHTFASLAEGWGIGELMLQRLLRHTRIRTQRSYRHAIPDQVREAGAKVRFPSTAQL